MNQPYIESAPALSDGVSHGNVAVERELGCGQLIL